VVKLSILIIVLSLAVMPFCHRQLYIAWPEPTPEQLALEHWCVVNFTVNHFGGVGSAQVLGPFPTDSIPEPYEQWDPAEGMDDEAWGVLYKGEDGQEHRGVVVYLTWENWFEWHAFPDGAAAPTTLLVK